MDARLQRLVNEYVWSKICDEKWHSVLVSYSDDGGYVRVDKTRKDIRDLVFESDEALAWKAQAADELKRMEVDEDTAGYLVGLS